MKKEGLYSKENNRIAMKHEPIDNALFVANRSHLVKKLKNASVAVFNSSDIMPASADRTHTYIQDTDLYYLTGIEQEETILVLCPDAKDEKHREILFIRETSEKIAVWEGQKYSKTEAEKISGIATIHWTKEFENIFRQLAVEAEHLYLNTNEHVRADLTVETRSIRFIRWCRKIFPMHKYERLAPIMHTLRPVKSSIEIDLIRQACHITEKTFRRLLRFIKPGVWEYQIEAEIYHEFLSNRSRGPAYHPVIATGVNSCVLHYIKNNCQCIDGDVVLMDFGAEYAGYASDVTRTVPVNGRFSERQRKVYDAVLRIRNSAINMLVPGTTLKAYHREVGKIVESELISLGLLHSKEIKNQSRENPLYKKYCMHGISHYLGLDVHDYGSKYLEFKAGMVFTCEPGIYIKAENLGIRIENDILITGEGPVDLTKNIPGEADEIEDLMN